MSAQEDEFESDLLFLTDEEDITNDSPPEADWLGMICWWYEYIYAYVWCREGVCLVLSYLGNKEKGYV